MNNTQGQKKIKIQDNKQWIKQRDEQRVERVSGYKRNDRFFQIAGTASLITLIIFCYNVPAFRQRAQSMNIHVISLSSLWSCFAGFMFQWGARKYFYLLTKDFFSKHLHPKSRYYTDQERSDKLKIITRQTFDGIYNLTVAAIYFYLFRRQIWFPTVLGGCGSCQNIFHDYPMWPTAHTQFFQVFYQFQLGTYFFYTFELLYLERQKYLKRNYGELLFHHIIASILILFSVLYNFIVGGSMVLFVHDASDSLRGFSRTVGESSLCIRFRWLGDFINYAYLVLWAYTRLVILPFCLIDRMYHFITEDDHGWRDFTAQHICLTVMNSAIFFIQCYWLFLIHSAIQMEKQKNDKFLDMLKKEKNQKTE